MADLIIHTASLFIFIQSTVASIFLLVLLIHGICRLMLKNIHFAQWILDYMKNRNAYKNYKQDEKLKAERDFWEREAKKYCSQLGESRILAETK